MTVFVFVTDLGELSRCLLQQRIQPLFSSVCELSSQIKPMFLNTLMLTSYPPEMPTRYHTDFINLANTRGKVTDHLIYFKQPWKSDTEPQFSIFVLRRLRNYKFYRASSGWSKNQFRYMRRINCPKIILNSGSFFSIYGFLVSFQSEYIADFDKRREFLCGFSGSAGRWNHPHKNVGVLTVHPHTTNSTCSQSVALFNACLDQGLLNK